LIFTTPLGGPVRLSSFRRVFKQWLVTAGLPNEIRIYDCRHAVATWLLASGHSPQVAKERLGHSRIGITLEHYAHVLPGQQKEASEALDNLLFG
jgi:integrase